MLNKTTETIGISIPSGSAAGEYTFKKTLRADFDECVGVCLYTTNNGGDPNFKVELVNDKSSPIFDMVHNREVEGNTAVANSNRYKEVLFETRGRAVTVRISTQAVLTSALTADFVLQVQKAK